MILTILGNYGPYPPPGGACSGYLLTSDDESTQVIMDLGSGTLSRLMGMVPIASLTGAVLSHLHYDHMSDMLPLQYALYAAHRSVFPVIAPATPTAVRALLDAAPMKLQPVEACQLGAMTFTFLPSVHPVEAYAISVECDGKRLVFTGDTNENPALPSFAAHADVLLADAAFREADWTPERPHLSAQRCGRLAREADVHTLILTHLAPDNTVEALIREAEAEFPHVRIAAPGLKIHV